MEKQVKNGINYCTEEHIKKIIWDFDEEGSVEGTAYVIKVANGTFRILYDHKITEVPVSFIHELHANGVVSIELDDGSLV